MANTTLPVAEVCLCYECSTSHCSETATCTYICGCGDTKPEADDEDDDSYFGIDIDGYKADRDNAAGIAKTMHDSVFAHLSVRR